MEIKPIGYIKTVFKEKFGIPRQSGRTTAKAEIIFHPPFDTPAAFKGLEGFSHIFIIFDFSLSHKNKFSPTVRPPRLGGNTRAGVFATRSPFRPNSLGLSVVKLVEIKNDGKISLIVEGADILDGTPIFDIKPYIPYADKIENARGGFAEEKNGRPLSVFFAKGLPLSDEDKKILTEILSDDPRPAFDSDGETYGMAYKDMNIKFAVTGKTLTVTAVEK